VREGGTHVCIVLLPESLYYLRRKKTETLGAVEIPCEGGGYPCMYCSATRVFILPSKKENRDSGSSGNIYPVREGVPMYVLFCYQSLYITFEENGERRLWSQGKHPSRVENLFILPSKIENEDFGRHAGGRGWG